MATEFRVSIDTGPEGLTVEQQKALRANGFDLKAQHARDRRATFEGEERRPGRRYIYLVDAKNVNTAETRTRAIVGPEARVFVLPHGGRVTGPDAR